MGIFSSQLGARDMAIDLGTANTLVYVRGRGIVVSEPSVVAMDTNTGAVHAVGSEAKRMIGRTPASISAIRPLRHGVIADFEVTEQMLRYFMRKVHQSRFAHPRLVMCAPSGVTDVEKRAVIEASLSAGARRVHLIEEPIAAAIGAGLEIDEPVGNMVVDVGGRDLVSGLPKSVMLTAAEVRGALEPPLVEILDAVKDTLERTPPELAADIAERGILLAGGGVLLQGFDERVREETGMPASLADSPLTCVAVGSGRSLEEFETIARSGSDGASRTRAKRLAQRVRT